MTRPQVSTRGALAREGEVAKVTMPGEGAVECQLVGRGATTPRGAIAMRAVAVLGARTLLFLSPADARRVARLLVLAASRLESRRRRRGVTT